MARRWTADKVGGHLLSCTADAGRRDRKQQVEAPLCDDDDDDNDSDPCHQSHLATLLDFAYSIGRHSTATDTVAKEPHLDHLGINVFFFF